MTHELKVREPYFSLIRAGQQVCDLRVCDRRFQYGDIAVFKRYKGGECTGETCRRRIVHVITDRQYCPKNYVLLELSEYGINERAVACNFHEAVDAVFTPNA